MTVAVKHVKGSEERYLLGQKHNVHILRAVPFIKLQKDTETVERYKMVENEVES